MLMMGLAALPMAHGENSDSEFDEEMQNVGPVLPSFELRDAALELPEWHPEDVRDDLNSTFHPTNLGGGLWPEDLWPLMPAPVLPSFRAQPPSPAASPSLKRREVDELWHQEYFGAVPAHPVVDPQGFLGEKIKEDVGKFLQDYTTTPAGISVRILVLGGDQKLPDKVGGDEVCNRWFPDQKGLVAVYTLGDPAIVQCYFSKGMQHRFTAQQLSEVRHAAIKEARMFGNSEEQLARFGIKLAVRLNLTNAESTIQPSAVARVKSVSWWDNTWKLLSDFRLLIIFCVLGVLVFLLRGVILRPVKSVSSEPEPMEWTFPDQEIAARLSAPHCGGTMAVLKFR